MVATEIMGLRISVEKYHAKASLTLPLQQLAGLVTSPKMSSD